MSKATTTTTTGQTELKKLRKDELIDRLEAVQAKPDGSKGWAYGGVIFMGVLSMGLNGYYAGTHGPNATAGWLVGMSITVIVLIVARVAGLKYKAGKVTAAKLGGAVVMALLALSVWHCAEGLAELMGCGIVLALPMAVGIDCGLVYCEWATLDS